MSTPSPFCGWRRGVGPLIRLRSGAGRCRTGTTATSRLVCCFVNAGGGSCGDCRRCSISSNLARFARKPGLRRSGRTTLQEFSHALDCKHLEASQDIHRRTAGCSRHRLRSSLPAGHHAGQCRRRHSRHPDRHAGHGLAWPARPRPHPPPPFSRPNPRRSRRPGPRLDPQPRPVSASGC